MHACDREAMEPESGLGSGTIRTRLSPRAGSVEVAELARMAGKMLSQSHVRPRVAVVGAGVIGLSTAVCLAETYGRQLDITVIAEHFSPNTTSDRAGAIYVLGGSYLRDEHAASGFDDFMKKHGPVTMQRFTHLKGEFSDAAGLRMVTAYKFYKDALARPWWSDDVCFDFEELDHSDVRLADIPLVGDFKTIWTFRTFHIQTLRYLAWLLEAFRKKGGLVAQRKLTSLNELNDYDVIVNCTGLAARELVGDTSVFPARGQLVVVRAPHVTSLYHNRESDLSVVRYAIPCGDGTVLLGGTCDDNEWSTEVDPETERDICRKCTKLIPALEGAEVVGGWAGLRPVRYPIRLEVEGRPTGPSIVHNYGHGGHGFILSWGSALEASKLACQCLRERGFKVNPHTKL